MDLTQLTAISPIDGRYRKQLSHLADYFSEYALIKYRVIVEVEYFLFLAEKKFFKADTKTKQALQKMVDEFSIEDAAAIKKTEAITNHDVKAVEYFIKTALDR
jgi:adenylosuccinate lyase